MTIKKKPVLNQPTTTERITLTIDINKELYDRLRTQSAKNNKSIEYTIESWIRKYVAI